MSLISCVLGSVRLVRRVGRPVLAVLVPLALAGIAVQAASGTAAAQTLPACTDSWANPVSGAWDDASMWTGGVPGGSDVACITVAGTYTVTLPDGDWFAPGPIVVGDGTGAGQETLAFPGCPASVSAPTARIFASGSLSTVPGGILELQNGSSCPGATVEEGGIQALFATVNLGGTLLVDPASTTDGTEFLATNSPLANTGTITLNGQLSLQSTDPTMSFDNTGVINGSQFLGLLVPQTGATMTNEGSIQQYVYFQGAGLSSTAGSTFANNAGGDLGSGTQVLMTSGTTFIQGAGTASAGSVGLGGGSTLDIAGSGSGTYIASYGTADMTGDLQPGQTLWVQGVPCEPPGGLDTAGSFTNNGTIIMDDSADPEFCDLAGLPVTPASAALAVPAGDTITNAGTIETRHTTLPGTLTISGAITNTGDGTVSVVAGSPLAISPGSLDNSGTVTLAAPLTLSGGYVQEQDGSLGIAVGSQLGNASLQASGTAALAGTLALNTDGIVPAQGSSATLLSAGSVTGTFGTVTGAEAGGGLVYQLAYQPAAVTVTVEPPIAQSISFTAPATGTTGGSATLTANGGGSGNPVTFSVDPTSGAGVCSVSGDTVSYNAPGSCVIDANQAGNTYYAAAQQVSQTITVYQAPTFAVASPPLTAVAGQAYSYTFTASGVPAPVYGLAAGAPSWLSINSGTGALTGTPPAGATTFTYSVTATNAGGTATAGPFTVTVAKTSTDADVSAALACPASMTVGGTGTCTLTVKNAGPAAASKLLAAVTLPSALSEVSCTQGCTRYGNVLVWTLPALAAGGSAQVAVTVKASKAGTVLLLAVAASGVPDPHPLNNLSIQAMTIEH
jgi:uncharacterized repeat protein (TIGR01451 family)